MEPKNALRQEPKAEKQTPGPVQEPDNKSTLDLQPLPSAKIPVASSPMQGEAVAREVVAQRQVSFLEYEDGRLDFQYNGFASKPELLLWLLEHVFGDFKSPTFLALKQAIPDFVPQSPATGTVDEERVFAQVMARLERTGILPVK